MRQFFKFVLATFVGLFLFFFIGFLLLLGIAAATSSSDDVSIAEGSVLELKLGQPVVERAPRNPFAEFGFGDMFGQEGIGLDEIKASIRKAKADDNIKGIFLNLDLLQAGMASVEEIRNALLDFKKSKKFVVAYSEFSTEKAYYLASVADRFYLNPQGTMELNGLSSEVMFFKGTLEKLDLQPYIFKVGEYKSAVEPFILDKMSEPSREQTQSFLNSLNDFMLRNIAVSRKKDFAYLKNVSDSMLVHNAQDAYRHGLVTHLGYYDEATDFMKSKTGVKKDKELKLVNLGTYKKVADTEKKSGSSSNKIAVIYASGDIVGGKGDNESIGGQGMSEAIRKARLDKNVKAVVLRINSPGGSSLASDVIWREVMLTKKVKPIIASMSDVAASGGYYIAMACDTIVAHPTTITGSIGVFGMMVNSENFLKNKLGITTDRVKTGKFSDVPSVTRAMTPYEKMHIQREVERIYNDFTTKAAQSRHMPVADLRKLASGRVWSGLEAKERGLVDVLGGMEQAIAIAARKAKLKEGEYRLRTLPAQKTFMDNLLSDTESQVKMYSLRQELGEMLPYYLQYKRVMQMQGIQARLPFEIEIN
ncbi:signal peptide peptidase SppA [Rufibacter latericius]|uniref:Signal peptide peptidase SppA n=1 Tax=Rufibacter latericius TaxID=2487040 RepID=A0A3M9MUX3_9BACT|nr:signal peptide peptidase SppA [Rufibacter latericius]RNI29304.1 signal peptide peptidase SppA [Rufibacter latericius]